MNILSLDLEGVLVVSANLFLNGDELDHSKRLLARERNYARYFLAGCDEIFDKWYLNTCVMPGPARKVMEKLGFPDYSYLLSDPTNKIKSLIPYPEEHAVVHVEDGMSPEEVRLARDHNIHYIEVPCYTSAEYGLPICDDNRLLGTLTEIRDILKI